MKSAYLILGFFLLGTFSAIAETEEEAMARMQKQLNSQIFGGAKSEPPPPAPARPAPPPAPAPAPVASQPEPVQEEALPKTLFTGYKLAGLHVGMGKANVFAILKKSGYSCNLQAAQQVQMMLGRTVCIYASMASPKMIMMTFVDDRLRDFEMSEEYKTGFPEEIFARQKSKFMKTYGKEARCKTKRRGEVCEVFGHGYRIMLRSKISSDEEASITHSFTTI